MAWAARIWPPVAMLPDRMTGPSKNSRTSATRAKGLSAPAWPPAPAHTRISPSAPSASAFFAWRMLVMSWNTSPP